jgi:hypothetical protein
MTAVLLQAPVADAQSPRRGALEERLLAVTLNGTDYPVWPEPS